MAVECVHTVDSYIKFSDHILVSLTLVGDISKLYATHIITHVTSSRPSSCPYSIESLNWVKANNTLYYELTRGVYLQTVTDLLNKYESDLFICNSLVNNLSKNQFIYNTIISATHSASYICCSHS